MDRISAVLSVNGTIPRRCVVLECGGIGDKVLHPSVPEMDLLSKLCEICRSELGQAHYPRPTSQLLELALTTNSMGAWEAARNDVLTGDLDLAAATASFRRGSNAAIAVGCLVGAQSFEHLANVGMVVSHVLKELGEESRADMGQALACQLSNVMDVFVKYSQFTNRDIREAVLRGFGKMVALARPPGDLLLNEIARSVLARKQEGLLHFFLNLPSVAFAKDAELVRLLLERAQELPAGAARYAPMALLARVAIDYPDVVRPLRQQVRRAALELLVGRDTVTATFELDSRMCVLAAIIAEETSGDDDLDRAVAGALRTFASEFLNLQTGKKQK